MILLVILFSYYVYRLYRSDLYHKILKLDYLLISCQNNLKMSQSLNHDKQTIKNNRTHEIVTDGIEPPNSALVSINLTTETCPTNRNKIMMRTSNKSLFKKKTEAELIKENILKCRYNRRVGQLKQLTQNNVQMFLRIKAQDSHYKYKTIHQQRSYKILPGKTSRAHSQTHASTHTNSQAELPKDDLKTRCLSLKRGLTKDFKSVTLSVNESNELGNVSKSTEIGVTRNFRIQRKIQKVSNKENQGYNYGENHVSEKYLNKQQLLDVQNKIVTKKLGLLIPSKDIAMLKAKNIFRRKQQQQPRTFNISTQFFKRREQNFDTQKRRQGLAEKMIDYNHAW